MFSDRFRVIRPSVFVISLTTVVILAVASLSSASDRLDPALVPDSAVGRSFATFFDMVVSEDQSRYTDFVQGTLSAEIREEFGVEAIVRYLDHVHDPEDAWVVVGFRAGDDPNSLRAIIRTEHTAANHAFVYAINPDDPTSVSDIDMVPAGVPSEILDQRIGLREVVAEMNDYFRRLGGGDAFSGVVLLAQGDKVIFEEAYGEASLRYDVPNAVDTRFSIGSITKLFTAAAIAKLIEEGKLSYEQPVGALLDQAWVGDAIGKQIELRHLLSHTGSTGNFQMHPDFQKAPMSIFRSLDAYAPFCRVDTLETKPGSQWQYSNTGFVLAGAMMEVATGTDWFEYMRSRVYEPLQLLDTDCFASDVPHRRLAEGYMEAPGGQWRSNTFFQRAMGCPAGSSYSTVRDLWRFARVLQDGSFISKQSFATMRTAHPDIGAERYGYGLEIHPTLDGKDAIGHSGGGPGVHAWLKILPEQDVVMVMLANRGTAVNAVNQRLLEWLSRWDPEMK